MSDVILYDAIDCINCMACMTACSNENRLRQSRQFHADIAVSANTSADETYYLRPVKTEAGEYPEAKTLVGFKHCHHCEKAPCLENCPAHAIERRPGGQVVIDEATCIGCRTCIDACPFDVPVYNPATNTASKCIGCYDRVESGLKQACVSACPTGAMISGTREEMVQEALRRQAHYQSHLGQDILVYGVDAPSRYVGELNWISIAPQEYQEAYLLPESPAATGMQIRNVSKSLGSLGIGATLVAAAAHGLFYMKHRKQEVQQAEQDKNEERGQ